MPVSPGDRVSVARADFLRHAPCMRVVKSEYDVCTKRYQDTMAKIQQPAHTNPQQQQQQREQQLQMRERQLQQHNLWQRNATHSGGGYVTQSATADGDSELEEQEKGIKAVCW